jgi:hypothetical protein
MRMLLRVLVVSGHLVALQMVAGAIVWWLSPWPWIAVLVSMAWLAVFVGDLRHPRFAGALSRWPRLGALLLAQVPALVFGIWNVFYFLGVAPRFELGAFVVQFWLTPLMPILALCPEGVVHGRDLWLWALSVAPVFVIVAAMSVAEIRRQTMTTSRTETRV